MMKIQKTLLLMMIISCAYLAIHLMAKHWRGDELDTQPVNQATRETIAKKQFESIYNNLLWSKEGGGSGPGSTVEFTANARSILYEVFDEFKIKSLLDAPCGSFIWMPYLLNNVSETLGKRGERFRYHGVDVVESIINASIVKYADRKDWQFSVCDFSQQDLPNGYELIFSRDALQHLSFEKVCLFAFYVIYLILLFYKTKILL